jgi:hypothetical protein
MSAVLYWALLTRAPGAWLAPLLAYLAYVMFSNPCWNATTRTQLGDAMSLLNNS